MILHPLLTKQDTIQLNGLVEGRPTFPLAFEIYTADISEEILKGLLDKGHTIPTVINELPAHVLQYVDDLLNNADDYTQMKPIVRELCIYCHKYGIIIHQTKTFLIHFYGPKEPEGKLSLHTITDDKGTSTEHPYPIPQQNSVCYLGYHTDNQLSCKAML